MEERGYNVIRCLGHGGQGRVYEVRDGKGRLRVVKQLPVLDEARKEDALRELRLLAALRHPCIVPYLDNFLIRSTPSLPAEDTLCLVMSRCEHDLRQECLNRRETGSMVEESRALYWLVNLCWGLEHLHSRKFLHRDLKPQNTLLTQSGRLLLADFGVACQMEHTEDLRSTRVGTVAFMSPEMLEGRRYGRKTDQWALGCVLFEIMALEPPLAPSVFKAVLDAAALQGLCARLPPCYSSALRETLMALLAWKPDDRPSNSDLLRGDLLRGTFRDFVQSLELATAVAGGQTATPNSGSASPTRTLSAGGYNVTASMQDFLRSVKTSPKASPGREIEIDNLSHSSEIERYLNESPSPAGSQNFDSQVLLQEQDVTEISILENADVAAGEWQHLLSEAEALLQPKPKAESDLPAEISKLRKALCRILGTEEKVDNALCFVRERQPLGETDETDELMLQVEICDSLGDDALDAVPLLERYIALDAVVSGVAC